MEFADQLDAALNACGFECVILGKHSEAERFRALAEFARSEICEWEVEEANLRYNAFISYSHQSDSAFARALQSGLEQLAKPWNRLGAHGTFSATRQTSRLVRSFWHPYSR